MAAPVRPGAAVESHRGAEWASPSEEALEQAAVDEIFHCIAHSFTVGRIKLITLW